MNLFYSSIEFLTIAIGLEHKSIETRVNIEVKRKTLKEFNT
ncbi:hypothetical protein HMPREF0548_1900 [Lactobacillus ultunensis DSM 16047]|uniref:Uncharacterized protein n=1 Tax=Lactobacillus ultunensis DSM 16047 TaxID=525365 RepID=C2EQF4_9LACO|nr:hypothetical protein HMPREF0548_1900 [Lactobacillus ultunensis DSM 16047]